MPRVTLPELHERLEAVEKQIVEIILPDMVNAKEQREKIKSDLERALAILTGAEKVGGYVKQYGPKAITFGAGIMTAAGIGNQKVLSFITSFFG